VEPLLIEYYGTGGAAPVSNTIKTITTKDRFGVLEPFMLKVNHGGGNRVRSINEPLGTMTTKVGDAIIFPMKLDILFRMLKPHELARAHSFPQDYKILGTLAEQTKQVGNSVPVKTARALTESILSQGG
jgi:DNA (cytosine-5)-methyltransferase 1